MLEVKNISYSYPEKPGLKNISFELKKGNIIAVLSIGFIANNVIEAIEFISNKEKIAHYDMRFAKPIDEEMLHEVFTNYNKIVTVEDGTVVGGFGSAVLEFMNAHGYKADVKIVGIPDRLVEHGTPKQLYEEIGIDANGIAETLREMSKISVAELVK